LKFVDEFRNRDNALSLAKEIRKIGDLRVNLMEVCGTHTVSIFKHGIREMLPEGLRLLSGPGCPVCVTPASDIEKAIRMAGLNEVILTTFGDMMRVPGITSNLETARAGGGDVRVVYSLFEALKIARENPDRKVVFFGVGFETTSPGIAVTLIEAEKEGPGNFSLFSCHKLVPPAMKALLELGEADIAGFICPGHVSTIIGAKPYEFIPDKYHIPCVIAGFEPTDILQAILMLSRQAKQGVARVEIQYSRAVREQGNIKAQEVLDEVFEPVCSTWRGIGVIPDSGLKLRGRFKRFDALAWLEIPEIEEKEEEKGCICGHILRGIATPYDCPLFGKTCTPQDAIGPCMVGAEGTCGAYYKYGGRRQ